jgi:hypothetical protein
VSNTAQIRDPATLTGTANTTNYDGKYGWVVRGDGSWFPPVMGGSGDPAPDGGGSTEGASSDGTSTDGTTTDDGAGKTTSEGDKKFTQDDVNRIAAAEASKAARGKVDPKLLGFTSAKEMQDFVEEQRKKTEEQKTEDDKAKEQAIADAVKAAETSVLSTANQRVIKAEFLLAAMGNGLTNREAAADAFIIAQAMDLWEGVEIDDEGHVSGFDEAFFKTLKEKKSYLFDKEPGTGDAGAGAGGGNKQITDEQKLREQYSGLPNW